MNKRRKEEFSFKKKLFGDDYYFVVSWKVIDFSLLKDKIIESPDFELFDESCRLWMYPNGEKVECSVGKIGIYVQGAVPPTLKIRFCLDNDLGRNYYSRTGIAKRHDVIVDHGEEKEYFRLGHPAFVDRKALLSDKFGTLLKDDTLTISCEFFESDCVEKIEDGAEVTKPESNFNYVDCYCSLSEDLRTAFNHLRFTDVILAVGSEEFPVHKFMLATRSKVFSVMFENNLKEKDEKTIPLMEVEAAAVREMLRFLYTGSVGPLSQGETVGIYRVADRYEILELRDYCRDFLIGNLSANNVSQLAEVADLHSDNILTTAVEEFFRENFRDILKTDEWLIFAKEKPDFYLELLKNVL